MSLNLQYRVDLPGGCWKQGICVRHADIRPLNGNDEAFLLEAGESLSAAARTTALLCRCLLRLGNDDTVSPLAVRCLTVGDREALLLHLWRLTFGECLSSVVTCPRQGCGERMDLEVKVSDLLLSAYNNHVEWREINLQRNGRDYIVRVRPPNGMDQELAAEVGRTNLRDAEALVLQRCVQPISADGTAFPAEEWAAEMVDRIEEVMTYLDPQAEVLLQLRCVACDQPFAAEFDTGTYLYRAMAERIRFLYREVHEIARSYHWSEEEILSMTPRKRAMYLNLLAGEEIA